MSYADIKELARKARKHNAQRAITGALVYNGAQFIQLIEGPTEQIDALYARITRDPRHREVAKLSDPRCSQRSFDHWSMQLRRVAKGSNAAPAILNRLSARIARLWTERLLRRAPEPTPADWPRPG